jgi:hypothetical protein
MGGPRNPFALRSPETLRAGADATMQIYGNTAGSRDWQPRPTAFQALKVLPCCAEA